MGSNLKIRFLVHASFILEYDGIKILTDPWLSSNGAFLKSWFQFPRIENVNISELKNIDYIYLSHEHEDHFDKVFLEGIDKSTKILISDFPHKRLLRELKELDFTNIIEIPNENDYRITDKLKVTIFHSEAPEWEDSGIIFHTEKGKILNTNDLKYSSKRSRFIVDKTEGGAIFHFLQYSGANWHPMVYKHYSASKKRKIARKKIETKFKGAIRHAIESKSKYIIPFAGPPCFLQDEMFHLNFSDYSIFPDQYQFEDYVKANNYDLRIIQMLPNNLLEYNGKNINIPKNKDQKEHIFSDKLNYLRNYQKEIGNIKFNGPDKIDDQKVLFEKFRTYFQPLISCSDYFRDKISMKILFNIQGKNGFDCLVNFNEPIKSITEYKSGTYEYKFIIKSKFLQHIIDNNYPWENFFLSLNFEAERKKGMFSEWLLTLLKFGNVKEIKRIENHYKKEEIIDFFDLQYGIKSYRVQKYCPHAGGNLAAGKIENDCIRCPIHGWEFEIPSGKCKHSKEKILIEEIK